MSLSSDPVPVPTLRATSLSSWVCAVKRAVDAAGHDGAALMSRAGLDLSLLADPQARFPAHGSLLFWRLALEATGDPLLGLRVGRQIGPGTYHALGYALMASATLREVYERAARYYRVVSDAGELRFEPTPGGASLRLLTAVPAVSPEWQPVVWCVIDAFMLSILRGAGWLWGPGFRPLEVRLQRQRPADHAAYEKALRIVPVYEAADNAVVFDDATLDRPLAHANPELARWNEQVLGRYLSGLGDGHLIARLKQHLRERLPAGDPSQDDLAQALSLSSRTLQRKLADEGTSFREVLNDTRQGLALDYLRDPRHSISDVAYLLGFAEVSAFTRAFRRWTGQSPTAWRDAQPR